jgi:hypothetical protein
MLAITVAVFVAVLIFAGFVALLNRDEQRERFASAPSIGDEFWHEDHRSSHKSWLGPWRERVTSLVWPVLELKSDPYPLPTPYADIHESQ